MATSKTSLAEKTFLQAEVYQQQGDLFRAVDAFFQALQQDPTKGPYWAAFAHSIRFLQFSQLDRHLLEAVERCFSWEQTLNYQDLAVPGFSLLKLLPAYQGIEGHIKSLNPEDLLRAFLESGLLDIPLFIDLLSHCIVPDYSFEVFCTKIRRALLTSPLLSPRLTLALASHCFLTEYVYATTAEEMAVVEELEKSVNAAGELTTAVEEKIARIACYRPLFQSPIADHLLSLNSHAPFNALLEQQIHKPRREAVIKETLPRYKPIENFVSLKVQQQYEENPYPRWVAPHTRTPKKFSDILSSLFPHLAPIATAKPLEVLVAGCGSGQHAINACLAYEDCHVLAVDLSLASLAYAKRKQEEYGIANIEFLQADILDLTSLSKRFDVIECVGVLHHMDDPVKGLKVLKQLLKNEGFLNLGLYSELSRQDVIAAGQLIAERGYSPSLQDIRLCRQEIFELPESSIIKPLSHSVDFYTASSCRDLIFHVQEHRFTLPQIAAIIEELDFEFIGFDLPHKGILAAYREMFPKDFDALSLTNWNLFERRHPLTFVGMYQFWVKTIG